MTWDEVREMYISNQDFECLKILESRSHIAALMAKNESSRYDGGVAEMVWRKIGQMDDSEPTNECNKSVRLLQLGSTIVTKPNGVGFSPVVEFFDHYLSKFSIQKQKMRGISIVEIMNDLKLKYTKEENIYKYINDYIASKST